MISLLYIVLFLGILPILLVYFKRKQINNYFNYSYPLIALIALGSLYEFVFTILLKINSEYWFRIYTLLAFLFISYYFNSLLEKKLQIFIFGINILNILLHIVLLFNWDINNNLQTTSYLNVLQSIFVFAFSIVWFINLFKKLENDSLLKNPDFYFVSSLVLYYLGTVFLFLMSAVLFKTNKAFILEYWIFNIFFNLVFRLLLLVGIWKAIQK